MAILTQEADIQSDGERIADCLRRFLTPRADLPRFQWLYKDNPQGQVRAWVAVDQPDQSIIGTAAAFPRRLYTNGSEIDVWILGDFCIDDRYRALGPALALQRYMLSALESSGRSFCYDFPGATMLAIYKRLRIEPFGRMLRMAKPLRIDRNVGRLVPVPLLAKSISSAGNWLLTKTARNPRKPANVQFAVLQGRCGDEFTRLSEKIADRYGTCVKRSAPYLNWRYLDNPYCAYELIAARRGGELTAYAVFGRTDEIGIIADLFGEADFGILAGLLHRVALTVRDQGAVTVSCEIFEAHPWLPLLRACGFLPRETKPVIGYEFTHRSGMSHLRNDRWFLMHGDRDS
jgi:hypothetical protein